VDAKNTKDKILTKASGYYKFVENYKEHPCLIQMLQECIADQKTIDEINCSFKYEYQKQDVYMRLIQEKIENSSLENDENNYFYRMVGKLYKDICSQL
jgi:hypothetical protein